MKPRVRVTGRRIVCELPNRIRAIVSLGQNYPFSQMHGGVGPYSSLVAILFCRTSPGQLVGNALKHGDPYSGISYLVPTGLREQALGTDRFEHAHTPLCVATGSSGGEQYP